MDVESFRELRSPRLRRPIRYSLMLEGDHIHGLPTYEVWLRIRKAASQVSGLISLNRVSDREAPLPNNVRIGNESFCVTLAGANGFTLHAPHGYVGADPSLCLHQDVLVGIGLALDWHGHSTDAAELIAASWRGSTLVRHTETAFPIARCLARANQFQDAVDIAEQLFADPALANVGQVFLMPFLAERNRHSDTDIVVGLRALARIARILEERGDLLRAAVLNYNAGNVLRGLRRDREAIRVYREAARLDPSYLERAYFWRELAGVLFLSRKYALAERLYTKSLTLEEDRQTRFLHTDAMLFSGRYREASESLEDLLKSSSTVLDAEWLLKRSALQYLREQTHLDLQKRTAPHFPREFFPREMSEGDIERICRAALDADALSALAWFNLGGVKHRAGDPKGALSCFLLAALIVPWDLDAWANIIGIVIQAGDPELLGLTLSVAHFHNGDDLLEQLMHRIPARKDEMLTVLTSLIDALPKRSDSTLLRLHRGPADWDEVHQAPRV